MQRSKPRYLFRSIIVIRAFNPSMSALTLTNSTKPDTQTQAHKGCPSIIIICQALGLKALLFLFPVHCHIVYRHVRLNKIFMSIKWGLPAWLADPANCPPPLFHHRHFPHGRAAKSALSSRAPIKHVKDGSLPPPQAAPILLGEKMRKTGTEGRSGDRMLSDCEGVGLSVKGVPHGPRLLIDEEQRECKQCVLDTHARATFTYSHTCTIVNNYPTSP